MLLAIDTSTDTASLALWQEDQLLAELTWHCRQSHSTQLLPTLTQLLERSGASLESVAAVIVAIGPGSYNGLRVGISTAKGLAFSLGVPIVGVSSLEAAAYQHAESGLPICPILNAGRGEIATATYQQKDSKWRKLAGEHLTTIEELARQTTERTLFCGELTAVTAAQLKRRLGQRAVIASPASRLRRAGFLAGLGQQRLKAGRHDTPATLKPIYLRQPQITRPKHRPATLEGSKK